MGNGRSYVKAGFFGSFGVIGAMAAYGIAVIAGLVVLVLMANYPWWVSVIIWAGIIGIAVFFRASTKAHNEQMLRSQAVEASEHAADWIRVHHGREPRDDDEVYLVARTKFWD